MKITKNEKRIIKEDIADLKMLKEMYAKKGKMDKVADIEKEINEFQKKLKSNTKGGK